MEFGEHLRVSDKKAGKNLRIILSSFQQDLEWQKVDLEIHLKPTRITTSNAAIADQWKVHRDGDAYFKLLDRTSFVTGTESSRRSVCQIDIKLFVMYRTIKFRASVPRTGDPDDNSRRFTAESVVFISYNSGTEEKNRQIKSTKSNSSSKRNAGASKYQPILFSFRTVVDQPFSFV